MNIPNVIVSFTSSEGKGNAISNSTGNYLFDLANIGYSDGETITYSAIDEFKNEIFSGSFTVSGGGTSLNIALSTRTDAQPVAGNRDSQIYNIGGKAVSSDNPLPVKLINGGDILDLTNNPETEWTITRSDRQPDKEKITLGNGDVYERTFRYGV